MPPTITTAPSREVIALANAVVHSKPPEIIIGEYIRLLRLHIAKGKRQDALSSIHHHLDRTSYWRAECERLKAVAKQTETETITLRLEIDALNAKLEAAKPAAPSKKRKKQDADVIPYPRSPKRVKHDTSSGLSSTLAFDETTEAALSEGGDVGITLLRTLYHLHTTLKQKGDADVSTLSYHIIEATSDLRDIVLQEARQFAAKACQYVDELKTALTLCRRATASILVAFNRLEKPEQDNSAYGHAAYAIIHMFREFLGVFAILSDAEALKAIAADSSVSTSSAKAKTRPPRVINIKDLPSMSLFTNFLEGIVNTLDPNMHSHKSLFEGFAFCVLTTLGGRLHQTVFGHVRAQTMEEEIMKSNAVDEIEDDGPSASLPPQDREQKQIRLEGPYLVHLLNHIMKAAPSYLGLIPPTNGRANVPTASGLKRGTLTVEAKTCLQRTLVNCIFGTEGVDEDDPLAHCLKMPVKPAPSITMPKIKENEVQDWFKGEMWRLLAWDILSKEGEW